MKIRLFAAALFSLGLAASAAASEARVILVGDSTMASKSGYGDALCARFTPQVECINLARGGRSSASFRAEGLWDQVQQLLRAAPATPTYVLIQFGHNDQPGKPGRSTDLVTEFPANMARYAQEVQALGGIPVLVTPLTRRSFKGPNLQNDLAPWAAATRSVAGQTRAVLLDLNASSYAAVQAMGQDEADTLAAGPKPVAASAPADPNKVEPQGTPKPLFDRTHLGDKGARLFSGMVADALRQATPKLAAYLPREAK
ncbi:rhamnogalacturonan acetylesterase [Massilia sp. TS11]|uniref:rhamnogalacturonan acetylesterase n=1 Tax=Massilia sp. TS11 TaxID=2908003 RepID=UPI001EDA5FBB|nr:rhamnogalacturonan acetylesterase [Massilia sp. TS11]MCG2583766.1 rhamnogalacturonan acetylesterase [Massilia sp. TS11]